MPLGLCASFSLCLLGFVPRDLCAAWPLCLLAFVSRGLCASVPLCRLASVPLGLGASVPLGICAAWPLRRLAFVLRGLCAPGPLCRLAFVPLGLLASVPLGLVPQGLCAPWPLCPLASVPLGLCAAWPLCRLASVSLGLCASRPLRLLASVFRHASVPLGLCASWPLCLEASVPLGLCASWPLCVQALLGVIAMIAIGYIHLFQRGHLAAWSTGNPSSPCLTHILHMSVTVLLGSANPCWVLSVSLDSKGLPALQCASCESLDFRLSVLPSLAVGVHLFNTPSDCTASSPSTLSSRGMRLENHGVVQWVLCCVYVRTGRTCKYNRVVQWYLCLLRAGASFPDQSALTSLTFRCSTSLRDCPAHTHTHQPHPEECTLRL